MTVYVEMKEKKHEGKVELFHQISVWREQKIAQTFDIYVINWINGAVST